MKRLIISTALAIIALAASAGDEERGAANRAVSADATSVSEDMSLEEYVRQESLEIPGLTAGCHVCEWRPKLNQKPAPDQCGMDASGKPLLGLFECGYSEDCERVCHFLGCGEG